MRTVAELTVAPLELLELEPELLLEPPEEELLELELLLPELLELELPLLLSSLLQPASKPAAQMLRTVTPRCLNRITLSLLAIKNLQRWTDFFLAGTLLSKS
jgi:hypothetical protein